MRKLLAILVFVVVYTQQTAGKVAYKYEYTGNCSRAYQYYLSLHFEEARACILKEIQSNPYNLLATYIADYEDCILLLLNCSKEDCDARADDLDKRMELLDRGDDSSPWYRLCKGGVYLHWAIISMRFGEQYGAVMKFRKSFALLKANRELFPQFEYNKPFAGLQSAAVGALPGSYKWVASIFGMKGSVKKGTAMLADFLADHKAGDFMYGETVLYNLYTRFYLLSEQKEVWSFLSSPQFSTADNLLNTFVKANIALDYKKSDAAIETLKPAATSAGYYKYPIFDYEMGVALLTKGDTSCVSYFQRYLRNNKSDIFIKDTWQKMAFAWYMAGNMQKAAECRSQIATHGSTRIDADKQAGKFAESGVWPMKQLLQVRLSIEGGYNKEALGLLQHIDTLKLTNPADKAEYFFRYGKVYEETDKSDESLRCYQRAINIGRGRHEQFAARAALQMGKIYERAGMKKEALARYNECLDMPGHDFQNSIDQQAKAGINRLEGGE